MTENQCDGCRRGLPLVDGMHTGPGGFRAGDVQVCTADRYVDKQRTPEVQKLIDKADRALFDIAETLELRKPMTKEEILYELRQDIAAQKAALDKVEGAVTRALDSSPEELDRMIDHALIAADINEAGDLRMWLVGVLRDFQDERNKPK